jgi:hypothetical protein
MREVSSDRGELVAGEIGPGVQDLPVASERPTCAISARIALWRAINR